MKKGLILGFILMCFAGHGQVRPWQIESDTTLRMILVSDTVTDNSVVYPELEYKSIDSLVKQIAVDTLGLDSSLWLKAGTYSLIQKGVPNDNILLGTNAGENLTTGVRNFIAFENLPLITTSSYNFSLGNLNAPLMTSSTGNVILGTDNLSSATSGQYSFVNGGSLATNVGDIRFSFINGASNAQGVGASLWYSFLNGNNLYTSGAPPSYSFANGFGNFVNVANGNFSFVNGFLNLSSGASSSAQYTFVNGRGHFNGLTGSVNYAFSNGRENAPVVTSADYSTFSGYRNLYNATGSAANVIAIGRENGFTPAVSQNNSIYLGYRQGYTNGAANRLMIGMTQDVPLIYGEFDNSLARVNGSFEVTNKTGTATTIAGWAGNKIVDTGVDDYYQDFTYSGDTLSLSNSATFVDLGIYDNPDQTIVFTNPELSITNGDTVNLSSVNYWDKADTSVYYSGGNVGIGIAAPLYGLDVASSARFTGVVRDGNGNFGDSGKIMTSNVGKLLWKTPSTMNLSDFNNDLGGVMTMDLRDISAGSSWAFEGLDASSIQQGDPLIITEGSGINITRTGNSLSFAATGTSPWTDFGTYLSSNSHDITVEDVNLTYRATDAISLNGRDGTGWVTDVVIGSGLSLSGGTLSSTSSSLWSDFGTYIKIGSATDDIWIQDGLLDDGGSSGSSGQVLSSTGSATDWIDIPEPDRPFTLFSASTTSLPSPGELNVSETIPSTYSASGTNMSVPSNGYYEIIANFGYTAGGIEGDAFYVAIRDGTSVLESIRLPVGPAFSDGGGGNLLAVKSLTTSSSISLYVAENSGDSIVLVNPRISFKKLD